MAHKDVIYSVGGTVQASGGFYISRKADEELLSLCREGAFAYVLASRQMGKSSLMVRTAEQLSAEGIRSITIDLSQIGTELDREKWYFSLLTIIEDDLVLETDAVGWWQAHTQLSVTHRLSVFFQEVALAEVQDPVVVLVDEIDSTLKLPFTDDFYATIRHLYNARANVPEFRRLSFVLIGVATPNDLISDPQRTPFNIGRRVDLTDFTLEEALPLAEGLGMTPEENRQVLNWIMKWTRGHPYLIQRLCHAIVLQNRVHWSETDVDKAVASLFFGEMSEQDHNLQFVRDMLTKRMPGTNEGDSPVDPTDVLTTYGEIRRGRSVPDEEQSLIKSHLKLSGVVRRENGQLRVRNPIYEEVFDLRWVKGHLPIHWLRRVPRSIIGLTACLFVALAFIVFMLAIFAAEQSESARLEINLRKQAETESERAIAAEREAVAQRQRAEKQAGIAEERRIEAEKERERAIAAEREAVAQRQRAEKQAGIAEERRIEAEKERERAIAAEREAVAQRQRAEKQAGIAEERRIEAEKSGEAEETQRKIAEEQAEIARQRQLEAEEAKSAEEAQRRRAEEQANIAEERRIEAEKAKEAEGAQRRIAEEQSQIVLARNLATQADLARSLPSDLRILLAVEAVNRLPSSLQNTQVLRDRLTPFGYATSARMIHQSYVYSAVFSSDGKYLATMDGNNAARVWDVSTGKEMVRMNHRSDLNSVALSPKGGYLATASEDGSALVWDISTGKELTHANHESGVNSIAFSPEGDYLATASNDGTASIWRMMSDIQEEIRISHEGNVVCVVFSSDSKYLATAGSDGTARVWDVSSGQEVVRINHGSSLNSVAFSPDSRYVATAGSDHTALVCEVSTGNKVIRIEQDNMVYSVAFSPDSRYLATSGKDRTARIWRVADGLELARMKHQDEVYSVCFSPDGRYLATASRDKTARIWLLLPEDLIEKARSLVRRNFTPEEWRKYLGDEEPYRKTWQDLSGTGE